jgi:hypothetical protein
MDGGVGGKTEWSIRQQCKLGADRKWHLATLDVFVTTQTVDGTREEALRALAVQAQVSFKLARQVMRAAEKEGMTKTRIMLESLPLKDDNYCGCCGKTDKEVKLRLLRIAGDGSRLHICRKGNGCCR